MKRAWPMVAIAVVAIAITFALARFVPTAEEPSSEDAVPALEGEEIAETIDEVTAYDRALEALNARLDAAQRASEEHPDEWRRMETVAAAFLERAELTGDVEDYLRAERVLREAFRVAPEGGGPFLTRAELHLAVHRVRLVLPDLAHLEEIGNLSRRAELRVLALRGDVARELGRFEEAERLHRELETAEHSPSSAMAVAGDLSSTGRFDDAERWLARAASRAADHPRLRATVEMQRSVLALARGRDEHALAHARRADRTFAGDWRIEAQLARVYAVRGERDEAARRYRALVDRTGRPELMDALADLLEAREAARVRAQASSAHEYALSLLPEAAYGAAATHFLRYGSPSRALELAQEDFELRPGGEVALRLAQALLRSGDRHGARQRIEALLATPFRSAELHATAARIFRFVQERDRADEQERLARAIHARAMEEIEWLHPRH